jgi:hypothetical protein
MHIFIPDPFACLLLRHGSQQERDPVGVALHPMRSQLKATANQGHATRTDIIGLASAQSWHKRSFK